MRLKKSRKDRICHSCGSSICKGDLYGQRTVRLGSEPTQEERDAVRPAILIGSITVKRDLCSDCAF